VPFGGVCFIGLILVPFNGDDEPKTLHYANCSICPIGADGGQSLPAEAWRRIKWREGTAERLASRFARLRVRVTHRDYQLTERRAEEWLLIEWPKVEDEPIKYWLSTLPDEIALRHLVDLAKLRWRIERDDRELKQEVGLGHFEGRGWRGFHHHATLCIAAYGFLISERETIPPSVSCRRAVPSAWPSRGLPTQRIPRCGPNGTSRTRSRPCDGNSPRPRQETVALSVPRRAQRKSPASKIFVTR